MLQPYNTWNEKIHSRIAAEASVLMADALHATRSRVGQVFMAARDIVSFLAYCTPSNRVAGRRCCA